MAGHAWLVTALNPKSLTFFVAFLPQFLDHDADFLSQMLVLEIDLPAARLRQCVRLCAGRLASAQGHRQSRARSACSTGPAARFWWAQASPQPRSARGIERRRWSALAANWAPKAAAGNYAFNDAHATMAFVGAPGWWRNRQERWTRCSAAVLADDDNAAFTRDVDHSVTLAIQAFGEGTTTRRCGCSGRSGRSLTASAAATRSATSLT